MDFDRELSEQLRKLKSAKEKIEHLKKLLDKEKDRNNKETIKKVLAGAEKELEEEQKKEKAKEPELKKAAPRLEEILKSSVVPLNLGSSPAAKADYVRPAQMAARPMQIRSERTDFDETDGVYAEKKDYKPAETLEKTAYKTDSRLDYIEKHDGDMWFKAKGEGTAFNPTTPLKEYTPIKESGEYKRQEQLKQMIEDSKKKQDELENYHRKKRMGLI
jgi:hypothetical protein